MKKNVRNKLIIISLFALFGTIALQIPFSFIIGSATKFTLFDFFAPSTGAFLGTVPGIVSVFLIQILNFFIHGKSAFDTASVIRLFPTLFAVLYFSKKRSISIIIPALCMFAFIVNPIGRLSWQYSLFWLIPIAAHFFPTSPRLRGASLYIRSLGATFTAHAVGSVLWIWAFGLTPQIWLSLIPQVITERVLFAGGISVFYLTANNFMSLLSKNKTVFKSVILEKQYILKLK
jgi:hypothetical protein